MMKFCMISFFLIGKESLSNLKSLSLFRNYSRFLLLKKVFERGLPYSSLYQNFADC